MAAPTIPHAQTSLGFRTGSDRVPAPGELICVLDHDSSMLQTIEQLLQAIRIAALDGGAFAFVVRPFDDDEFLFPDSHKALR